MVRLDNDERPRRNRIRWVWCLVALVVLTIAGGALVVFTDVIFRNMGYAKELEVTARIMTPGELALHLVEDPIGDPILSGQINLSEDRKRLMIVEIVNKGGVGAWGTLICEFDIREIRVDVPGLSAGGAHSYLYVVDVSPFFHLNSNPNPDVDVHWKKLCTK